MNTDYVDGFGLHSAEIADINSRDAAKVIWQDDEVESIPESLTHYMGREIAQTMHFSGSSWLIRESREQEERCSMLLANMGLRTEMTVCDMGCGNGYYALPIAEIIGHRGQVIAVDVQIEMLERLQQRMAEKNITNITPILGAYHDPFLEPETIDLLLMVDVYHEFSHPEPMLSAIRRALKPNGIICLVEYRAEDPKVPIKELHKMSKDQINKEYLANGFRLVREFDRLSWQHVMFFEKDGRSEEEISESLAESR
ncbi:MAG TPA: class I SAM-dependent methyltransferase [Pirellulaceae bacterium]|nr:class I SAM-dependent methyltransferase [Pirellulaceae bacterium]HMO92718.1 class I SAM-dependent methyltransferase [Pirellulaceae bacterium]HMP70270.1 class I SAM-dependent methyltransferase [Pirellulaceae bacterium]